MRASARRKNSGYFFFFFVKPLVTLPRAGRPNDLPCKPKNGKRCGVVIKRIVEKGCQIPGHLFRKGGGQGNEGVMTENGKGRAGRFRAPITAGVSNGTRSGSSGFFAVRQIAPRRLLCVRVDRTPDKLQEKRIRGGTRARGTRRGEKRYTAISEKNSYPKKPVSVTVERFFSPMEIEISLDST